MDNAMPYDQLLAEMATADSMQVRVSGKVSDVCQMSGCWLDVQSESGGPGMHVTFKNEAFTVPKDLSGKKVVMQGMAYRELTSVESLQAAAREAGKSQAEIDAIQQPTYEVSFEASGLKIVD